MGQVTGETPIGLQTSTEKESPLKGTESVLDKSLDINSEKVSPLKDLNVNLERPIADCDNPIESGKKHFSVTN